MDWLPSKQKAIDVQYNWRGIQQIAKETQSWQEYRDSYKSSNRNLRSNETKEKGKDKEEKEEGSSLSVTKEGINPSIAPVEEFDGFIKPEGLAKMKKILNYA